MAGTWCAKALAIVVQHNRVVNSTHGLVLYSKGNDPDNRMTCVECCYVVTHTVRIPGGMTEEETCLLKSYRLIRKTCGGSVQPLAQAGISKEASTSCFPIFCVYRVCRRFCLQNLWTFLTTDAVQEMCTRVVD